MARAPRDPARAREAILDAALRRFSSHGYVGARIADVAKDAGYSEALVYFHFQTKAGLFREVVSRIDADTTWFQDDGTRTAFVERMYAGELHYHTDARWRALDHVWAEALGGERELLEFIRPKLRTAVGALEETLAHLGDTDTRRHALLLLAVSYGTRVLRRYDPDAVSPEEAADLMRMAAELAVARASSAL